MTCLYDVAETFVSINGEGPLAGQLAVFVRFAGCNLACPYCDTKWANAGDVPVRRMTAGEIVDEVLDTGVWNVTLTGGEPLLQPEIGTLLSALTAQDGLRVEVETNGSVPLLPFLKGESRAAFTMDYKLPSSGMEERMVRDNLYLLGARDTVKFVCGGRQDLDRARAVIEEYGLTDCCHVFLSPVFGDLDPAEMVDYMKRYSMNGVNLQLQLHKFIWDPNERGV